jgi:hypothetical protein
MDSSGHILDEEEWKRFERHLLEIGATDILQRLRLWRENRLAQGGQPPEASELPPGFIRYNG